MAAFDIKILDKDKISLRVYGKDVLGETDIPILKQEVVFTREAFRKIILKGRSALQALDETLKEDEENTEFDNLDEKDL